MNISIPYGHTSLDLSLPDSLPIAILKPRETPGAPDPGRIIQDAINSADWSPFQKARTAAIAINDKTRPVAHDLLLPPLLSKLEQIGIARDKITLIVATGSHKPMPPEELPLILPPEVIRQYRVISHDIEQEHNIVRLGMTRRKTVISVNRTYLEANLRLVVGNVEPHQFAGFSGGVKTAVIGLAGWDTINGNHRMMTEPNAALGRYDDNPVREDIEDMGRVVGIHLALNTLMNGQKQIVKAFFGPPLAVMRAAVPAVRQVYELPVPEPFDLMIVSPGGYPKDINIYQAQKALGHAALVTKPDGTIIVAAACVDGSGSKLYEGWVRDLIPTLEPGEDVNAAVIRRFKAEGYRIGPHKAYQIARDTVGRRVIWITDLPAPADLLLESAPTLAEAVARALAGGVPGRIGVMPYANATIPALAPVGA